MPSPYSWYIRGPALLGLFLSLSILVSIVLSMVNTGGMAFYFTLLYEFPFGNTLEMLSAIFFLVGFIGILVCMAVSLHTEYLLSYKGLGVYITGIIAVVASLILVPISGQLPGHAIASALSVLSMLVHIGFRRWWYIILPLLFGVPLMFLWILGSGDLEFSIIQLLLGASLFFFLYFDFLWPSGLTTEELPQYKSARIRE